MKIFEISEKFKKNLLLFKFLVFHFFNVVKIYFHEPTSARKKNVTDKRLMFHPSVDYQHAIDLENYYECYMIRQGCPRYLVEKNLTIDGVSIEDRVFLFQASQLFT